MDSDISAGYLCVMKVWAVQALELANDTSGNSSFSKNWKLQRDLPHCDNVTPRCPYLRTGIPIKLPCFRQGIRIC